ncbi:MAG: TetR family transcriptional regulator [Alphaproteobacteria bacterium]|nr:TetR family transcriptional regulator [Alphaproteobacteria bacterium]
MRARILATADRLFYHQGIRAVGVDTVADEVGISKRTLYNYFPSKEALVAAYLEGRASALPPSDLPPVEQVLGSFDRLERYFESQGFRGCPFVNAIAELSDAGAEINKIAIDFKEGRRLWYRDLLVRLGVADPDGLATQLRLLIEGAIATALVSRNAKVARSAGEAARALLAGAGVQLPVSAGAAKSKRKR